MPVNDTTTNRSYQKPNIANTLSDDVGRLRSALDAIDTDMASKAPTAGPTFTGVTTIAAGTAAAPSLTFTGATSDTGFYSPGTDQVAISTGGTGRLFVDDLGRVGVNTASPTYSLDVTGQARFAGDFHVSGSSVIDAVSQNLFLQANTGYEIVLRTNGANERVRIDSSGRLLVGTSSALNVGGNAGFEPLQVNGIGMSLPRFAAAGNGSILTFSRSLSATTGTNSAVTSGTSLGAIEFTGADGTAYPIAANIVAAVDGTPGTNDMPGRLVFSTTADGAATPTERMRISQDGAVKIAGDNFQIATSKTPASATAAGTTGQIAWDANYIYVCTATNTWKRAAIATW